MSQNSGGSECLLKVCQNVVNVLNAYTDSQCLGLHASLKLLLFSKLPVSRRRRMAGQRLRVTDVDETLEESELVVKLHARIKAALDTESQQSGWLAI